MGFITLITNISILGVLLGTMVLIVALSISNGFQTEVRDQITGALPHGQLRRYFYRPLENYDSLAALVQEHPSVVAVSPSIEAKSVIEYTNPVHDVPPIQDGVKVFGVVDSLESRITTVAQQMVRGEWGLDSAYSQRDRKNPAIIIGEELARGFGVDVGSEVVLMSTAGEGDLTTMTPRMSRFTVAGIFKTGMYEYDRLFTYINLDEAQRLYNVAGVQFLNFRCEDIFTAAAVAKELNEVVGHEFKRTDWESRNQSLFQWMEVEKRVILIVISLIMLVAAFNIASSLVMMVMEKRREIGILRSIGARRSSIVKIFLLHGGIIGLIGSLGGTIAGITLCVVQDTYQLIDIPGDVYFISSLPVLLMPRDVISVFVAANILCLLAALYPAWRASKLIPAEAVRID